MRKRHSLETARGLHKVIKPDNAHSSAVLLQLLEVLVQVPRREWFSYPFLQAKKNSNLHRRITNPTLLLYHVQDYVNKWIERTFDLSFNLATKGQSVAKAIKGHPGAACAFRFDLKSAYEFASKERISLGIRKAFNAHDLTDLELELLLDIVTFDQSAPQGSTTSRNIYTIAVRPVFLALQQVIRNPKISVQTMTLFEDDFLISFKAAHARGMRQKIENQVTKQVERFGFQIGRQKWYLQPPFEFLGTKIYADRLEIVAGKEAEILERVQKATSSPRPLEYRNSIKGLLAYVRRINGDGLTPDLTIAFRDYYAKVNVKIPEWLKPKLPNF